MKFFTSWEAFGGMMTTMLDGTLVTLQIFAFTLLFSIPLGFIICFGRMSRIKPIKWFSQFYILIFRGTPLMLQLIFFWFGLGILRIPIARMTAGIIAFSLNYAAYFAEIFRGGIQSVPRGQHEAADMLGFTRAQSFFKIILPQVTKAVLPPVGNEVITLVKDTALVYVIAISDLLREAQIMMMNESSIIPLAVAFVFYLVMTTLFTFVFNKIEARFNYYKV